MNLFNSIFGFYIIKEIKNGFLLSCADVAEHRHVVTCGHVPM